MIRAGTGHRRSLRLIGYDCAQAGAYFVAICAQDHACLFGEVIDGTMYLGDAGRRLAELWNSIPSRFPTVAIDLFVVMPNHLHGIIVLTDTAAIVGAPLVSESDRATIGASLVDAADTGATTRVAPTFDTRHDAKRFLPTLGAVIGAFKSASTVEYIRGVKTCAWREFGRRLWQRNYYEHVIRNETSLHHIRRYIDENPSRWTFDANKTP